MASLLEYVERTDKNDERLVETAEDSVKHEVFAVHVLYKIHVDDNSVVTFDKSGVVLQLRLKFFI